MRSLDPLAALAALCLSLPAGALPGDPPRSHRLQGSTARKHPKPRTSLVAAAPVAPGQVQLPHLDYYGGRIVSNVKIVGVYWGHGTYFGNSDGVALRDKTDAFYSAFPHGPQFEWLSEYATDITAKEGGPGTNQSLGPGNYLGGKLITPSIADASFSSADVIHELGAQIDAGKLPPNDENTVYMVHFPPGVSIVDGNDKSCVSYCAFHDSFSKGGVNVFYGAIPDHSPGSGCEICGESSDWFENMTASSSHEVVEVVTDPAVGAVSSTADCGPAWCDAAPEDDGSVHNEIGDICEGEQKGDSAEAHFTDGDGKRWVIQREWSNQANACIATRADAFSISLSPPQLAIHGAGTYAFTISSTVPASGPTTAALQLRPLPVGVSGTFGAPTLTTGVPATLQLTTAGDVPSFRFAVFANSGSTLAMGVGSITSASATADDFSASTSSARLSLKAGEQATLRIDTARVSGSALQSISIDLTSAPSGVSITAPPNAVQAGQSAALAVSAAPGSPSAPNSTLQLTLSNGLRSHTVAVPVVIDGDDFGVLSDAPAPLHVSRGSTARFHITTSLVHGSPQALAFSAKQVPAGVTLLFDPPAVQAGAGATVTVKAEGAAPEGLASMVVAVSGPVASTDVQTALQIVSSSGCSTGSPPAPWLAALALLCLRRRRGLRE